VFRTDFSQPANLRLRSRVTPGMSRYLIIRPLLTVAVFGALLAAAQPAAASPPATAWTVYGDVIVELTGPKDSNTGLALRPR
jgi:hypothetical protein